MIPRWLTWTLLALACWGAWAVLGRLIGSALSAGQSQALSTLGTLPVIALLARARRPAAQGNRRRGLATGFAAGLLTAAGNMAYFAALNAGEKAATVIPLTALYPLVTVLLAVLFLRERLRWIQWAGVVLALAAIYLFNVPQENRPAGSALALCAVPIALWGVSGLLQKVSTLHVSGEESTLAFLTAFIPLAAILVIREPLPSGLDTRTTLLALALGLAFALGNGFLLRAFAANGKASVIAPLAGLYPLAALPFIVLILRERISPREATGIAVALAAVAAIAAEGSSPTPPREPGSQRPDPAPLP